MNWIDWLVVGAYFVGIAVVGFAMTRRGSKSMTSFFAGSRSMPWWLAGASLIATSFGAGTPMWVTGIVRKFGVQSAWLYWTYFIGVGIAVFVFSRYWRRVGVLTDLEMMKLRYGPKAAIPLRVTYSSFQILSGFLFFAGAVIGGKMLFAALLGIPEDQAFWWVIATAAITIAYSASSGLLGVAWTDLVQLIVSFVGVVILAVLVIVEVGGVGAMADKLQALDDWPGRSLTVIPEIGSLTATQFGALSLWNAIAFFGLLWWALAVNNGYIAQRLFSCRSEKDSSKAMLFYGIGYWGVLAWPWIVVALGSLLLLPASSLSASQEDAYPKMIVAFSPTAVRGLLMASMLAAAMSTISTFVNIKSAYFVNDFYRLVIVRNASQRHYVWVSRVAVVGMFLVGVLCASFFTSILELGFLWTMLGSVACILLLLRWQWGRFNMWGEIVGLIVVTVSSILIIKVRMLDGVVERLLPMTSARGEQEVFSQSFDYYGLRVLVVMVVTVSSAVVASLLTRPVEASVSKAFLSRVRPSKIGWCGTLRRLAYDYEPAERPRTVLVGTILVTASILTVLLGLGQLVFGRFLASGALFICFAVCLGLVLRLLAGLAPAAQDGDVESSESQKD